MNKIKVGDWAYCEEDDVFFKVWGLAIGYFKDKNGKIHFKNKCVPAVPKFSKGMNFQVTFSLSSKLDGLKFFKEMAQNG